MDRQRKGDEKGGKGKLPQAKNQGPDQKNQTEDNQTKKGENPSTEERPIGQPSLAALSYSFALRSPEEKKATASPSSSIASAVETAVDVKKERNRGEEDKEAKEEIREKAVNGAHDDDKEEIKEEEKYSCQPKSAVMETLTAGDNQSANKHSNDVQQAICEKQNETEDRNSLDVESTVAAASTSGTINNSSKSIITENVTSEEKNNRDNAQNDIDKTAKYTHERPFEELFAHCKQGMDAADGEEGDTDQSARTAEGEVGDTEQSAHTAEGEVGNTDQSAHTGKGKVGDEDQSAHTAEGKVRDRDQSAPSAEGEVGDRDQSAHNAEGEVGDTDQSAHTAEGETGEKEQTVPSADDEEWETDHSAQSSEDVEWETDPCDREQNHKHTCNDKYPSETSKAGNIPVNTETDIPEAISKDESEDRVNDLDARQQNIGIHQSTADYMNKCEQDQTSLKELEKEQLSGKYLLEQQSGYNPVMKGNSAVYANKTKTQHITQEETKLLEDVKQQNSTGSDSMTDRMFQDAHDKTLEQEPDAIDEKHKSQKELTPDVNASQQSSSSGDSTIDLMCEDKQNQRVNNERTAPVNFLEQQQQDQQSGIEDETTILHSYETDRQDKTQKGSTLKQDAREPSSSGNRTRDNLCEDTDNRTIDNTSETFQHPENPESPLPEFDHGPTEAQNENNEKVTVGVLNNKSQTDVNKTDLKLDGNCARVNENDKEMQTGLDRSTKQDKNGKGDDGKMHKDRSQKEAKNSGEVLQHLNQSEDKQDTGIYKDSRSSAQEKGCPLTNDILLLGDDDDDDDDDDDERGGLVYPERRNQHPSNGRPMQQDNVKCCLADTQNREMNSNNESSMLPREPGNGNQGSPEETTNKETYSQHSDENYNFWPRTPTSLSSLTHAGHRKSRRRLSLPAAEPNEGNERVAAAKLSEKDSLVSRLARDAEKADKYKNERDNLRRELKKVQEELEESRRNFEEKDRKIQGLHEEAEQCQRQQESTASELRNLREENETLKQELSQPQRELETKTRDEQARRAELVRALQQLEEKTQTLLQLRHDLDTSSTELHNLQEQLVLSSNSCDAKDITIQDNLRVKETELREKDLLISGLLNSAALPDIETLKQELSQAQCELETKTQDEQARRAELVRALQQLEEKTQTLLQLRQNLDTSSTELENLQEQLLLSCSTCDAKDERIQEIINGYEERLREKDIIISGMARSEARAQQLEATLAELNQTHQAVLTELVTKTHDLQELQGEHQRTTQDLEEAQLQWNLENESCREKESEIREIKRRNEEINRNQISIQTDLESSVRRINQLEHEKEGLNKDVLRLQSELRGISQRYEQQVELTRGNERVAAAKHSEKDSVISRLARDAEKADKYKNDRDNLRRELEIVREELEESRRNIQDKDKRMQGLHREAEQCQRQQESTASELREALTSGSNLRAENAGLTERVEQLQQDLQALKFTSEERENAFRAAAAAAEKEIERKDLVIAGLTRNAARAFELSNESDVLRQNGERLQRDLDSQRQTCAGKETKIRELEESLSQFRQSDGENRSALRQLQDERQHHLERAQMAESLQLQVQQQMVLLTAQNDRISRLEVDLQSTTSELEMSRNNLSGMNGAFTRLSRSINDHEDREGTLQQQVTQLTGEVQGLKADNAKLSRLIEETLPLRAEAASLRGRNENLERVRADLERQQQQTRDALREKERAVARLEAEMESCRSAVTQLSTLRQHNDQQQLRVNQLQNEVDYSAQIVRDNQARLQNMQQQLDDCERQRLRSLREAQAQRDVIIGLEEQRRRLQAQLTNRNGSGH